MLLELTDGGEVRSSARAGGAAPSLGVHALPLAMRANREFASSAVMAGLPPARDDPNPNHPILSAEHDVDDSFGLLANFRVRLHRMYVTKVEGPDTVNVREFLVSTST